MRTNDFVKQQQQQQQQQQQEQEQQKQQQWHIFISARRKTRESSLVIIQLHGSARQKGRLHCEFYIHWIRCWFNNQRAEISSKWSHTATSRSALAYSNPGTQGLSYSHTFHPLTFQQLYLQDLSVLLGHNRVKVKMRVLHCINITAVFLLCQQSFVESAVEECSGDAEYSILGMMLRRHIFKKIPGAPLGNVCLWECYRDVRCQSFNYVISQYMCELSNRTKEARPEDFVPNSDRYYFKRDMNRGKFMWPKH